MAQGENVSISSDSSQWPCHLVRDLKGKELGNKRFRMKACEWAYGGWQEVWRFLYHTLTKSLNQQIKWVGQLTLAVFSIYIPWMSMLGNIKRVPGWQRWKLCMISPAWTSTFKANLTTPSSQHPTLLTHWDFVFPSLHLWVLQCSDTQKGALLPWYTAKVTLNYGL